MLELRAPRPHDLDGWLACLEAAFGIRLPRRERERISEALDERCLAALRDGEVVGTLAVYEIEQTLPGPCPGSAVAFDDVAVLPTERRRGVLTAMVGAALEAARRRGEDVVVLSASEGAIYGRFGFAPASFAARYRLGRGRARLAPDGEGEGGGEVHLLSTDEAAGAFPDVLEAARAERPGELSRRPEHWAELLAGEEGEGAPARFLAAYAEGGRIDGYAIYDMVARGELSFRLALRELVSTSRSSYRALWAYLLGVDLVEEVVTDERPLEEPLRWLLEDPRALETTAVVDRVWLRLVRAEEALAARRYRGAGRLRLGLADRLCPWNEGCHLLEVSEDGVGAVSAADGPGEAELALGSGELAAVYLGGTSFAALARAGRVEELRPGAVARADALFASDPPPFATVSI